jgi:hypothetical protein
MSIYYNIIYLYKYLVGFKILIISEIINRYSISIRKQMLTWGIYAPCMGHNYFTLLHLIN